MPLSGRAGGGGLRVYTNTSGGRKLQRFLNLATNPVARDTLIAGAAAKVYRRTILPQLKSRVPKRTGALSKSLKITQKGPSLQLRGIFYARMVRWDNGKKSVAGELHEIVRNSRNQLRSEIKRAIRREVGV